MANMFPNCYSEVINDAIPLHDTMAALESLKTDYDIEVAVDGNIANGKEPRINVRTLQHPVRGLTGTLT